MVKLRASAKKLLNSETIVWFTTVGGDLTPQTRPVWFVPDGDDLLIYSQPNGAKLAHIKEHPRVSLHFNADKWGSDETVVVITGTAKVEPDNAKGPLATAYVKKYKKGMAELDMTPEQFAASYSRPIRVHITSVR